MTVSVTSLWCHCVVTVVSAIVDISVASLLSSMA